MNQYKNEISCADYRFVYMGPKGTWTPLHADVFRSYSWSANVCGRKYWLFLSPSECHKIFDRYGKNYVYDVYGDICEKKFPEFNKAMWSECMQESNEIIFVPSGWYHQVHNLEDTISINHNWFNSHNLSWVWNLLLKDYVEAKEYIEDIREICNEFERICQRNLAANTGMNLHDFFVFLTRFALANLTLLRDLCNENDAYSLSRVMANHVLSNIRAIRSVALCMVSVEAFSEENLSGCSEENLSVSSVIKGIMEEQNFHDLLCALTTTLEALCQGQHVDHCLENMLEEVNIVDLSCFYIGSPADLVKLIEEVIPNRYNLCN
ncbi:hypothetical protein HPP92_023056 [Vanilla planifolia]|uniref:JmjC domain-containing protein n=1 Tax=Vanilla planifolia TaxID=51239 RepID=A0A835PVW5_VANPL|nr:hypothetical protein HPP92_023056 [Vanilla planifolia]